MRGLDLFLSILQSRKILALVGLFLYTAAAASHPPMPVRNYNANYWLTVEAYEGPACRNSKYKLGSSVIHHPTKDQSVDSHYITGTCQKVKDVVGSVAVLAGEQCTVAFWSGTDCRGWEWRLRPYEPCIDLTWASMRLWCWDGPLYGPKGPNGKLATNSTREVD